GQAAAQLIPGMPQLRAPARTPLSCTGRGHRRSLLRLLIARANRERKIIQAIDELPEGLIELEPIRRLDCQQAVNGPGNAAASLDRLTAEPRQQPIGFFESRQGRIDITVEPDPVLRHESQVTRFRLRPRALL